MTNPNHEPTRPSLDPRLVQLADTLTVGSVPQMHDATLAEFRLRYGEAFHADIEQYGYDQLAHTTDQYCKDLGAFIGVGQPDRNTDEEIELPLPTYLTEEEKLKGVSRADFQAHQLNLKKWLEFAHNHDKKRANSAFFKIVLTIQQFDDESVQQAIEGEDEQIRFSVRRRYDQQAGMLLTETVSNLCKYNTDSQNVRNLLATPFIKKYGTRASELYLRNHFVDISDHLNTRDEYTENYHGLLTDVKNILSNPTVRMLGDATTTCLANIVRRTPAEIMDLIENSNDTVISIVQSHAAVEILKMDEQDLTPVHLHLLEQIEADITLDSTSYSNILYYYQKRDGQVPDYKLERLAQIYSDDLQRYNEVPHPSGVPVEPGTPLPDANIAAFVCANISAEKLQNTLETFPSLTGKPLGPARSVAIHRLTEIGLWDEARKLIANFKDSADEYQRMERLRHIGVMCEARGDIRQQNLLLDEAVESGLPVSFQQEIIARRFVTAYDRKHHAATQAAFSELSAHFNEINPQVRLGALKLACRTFLDIGYIQGAEDCMLRLVASTDSLRREQKYDADNAFLAVVQAYVKADQQESAVRLIYSYLDAGRPINRFALQAMELTLEPNTACPIDFGARHINPLLRQQDRLQVITSY